MKTENLPLIGLERFKQHHEHITYMDDNIAVVDSLNEMMETNKMPSSWTASCSFFA